MNSTHFPSVPWERSEQVKLSPSFYLWQYFNIANRLLCLSNIYLSSVHNVLVSSAPLQSILWPLWNLSHAGAHTPSFSYLEGLFIHPGSCLKVTSSKKHFQAPFPVTRMNPSLHSDVGPVHTSTLWYTKKFHLSGPPTPIYPARLQVSQRASFCLIVSVSIGSSTILGTES